VIRELLESAKGALGAEREPWREPWEYIVYEINFGHEENDLDGIGWELIRINKESQCSDKGIIGKQAGSIASKE